MDYLIAVNISLRGLDRVCEATLADESLLPGSDVQQVQVPLEIDQGIFSRKAK